MENRIGNLDMREHPDKKMRIFRDRYRYLRRTAGYTQEQVRKILSGLPSDHNTLFTVSKMDNHIEDYVEIFGEKNREKVMRMIVGLPAMLGLDIEGNVKPKITILRRAGLNDVFILGLLEMCPSLLGSKRDKYWIIARILHDMQIPIETLTVSQIGSLDKTEIESLILASMSHQVSHPKQFQSEGKKQKKIGTKAERQKRLHTEDFGPKYQKLITRYRRGYPLKQETRDPS